MKKLILAIAVVCAATFARSATVGWTHAGMANYVGDAYKVFVIGQNSVESIAAITTLLDAGSDVSSYQFGAGVVASNGAANTLANASGKTLGTGTYTEFMVLFDSATPTSGSSKYVVVSGTSGQTIEIGDTTATKSFAAGNVSSIVNNASNWQSYGAVPEPTSGLLMLLGMAGLALRRRRA